MCLLNFSCRVSVEPADLILSQGRIVTLDPSRPIAEAMAVRGAGIVAIGSTLEILNWAGPETRVIDLEGHLVVPGFIEGHGHFLQLGVSRMSLDLSEARGWDEIVVAVADEVSRNPAGNWIIGRGWHQEKWNRAPSPAVKGLPVHDTLSAVSPDHPVLLTHASGHAAFANAAALRLAGVDERRSDPEGGEIVRDRRGRPTGALLETAQRLVRAVYEADLVARGPESLEQKRRRAVALATEECLSKGITSFQDAGSSWDEIDFLRRQVDEDALRLRLWVMIRASLKELSSRLPSYRWIGYGNDYLTVRAIKVSLDGALGSHGAWLLEPYSDQPESTGFNTFPLKELEDIAGLAAQHDFQLCVHAIGDRANREALDLYERIFRRFPKAHDWRWRIEHAQHLHPDDIPRFGRLGVIASMQGIHCTSDAPWVIRRLGETRAKEGAYLWRKLLDSGALIANGSDAPVEDVNPLLGFYASVTRRLPDGTIFYPAQRMTREEALRSFTIHNARAAFEGAIKGSLEVGKLADITVLSRDILTIPEEDIPGTTVLYTIVGGRVEYEAGEK